MVLDRAAHWVTSWADEARRIWLDVKDRESDRTESAIWSNANSVNRLSYLMCSLMLRLSVLRVRCLGSTHAAGPPLSSWSEVSTNMCIIPPPVCYKNVLLFTRYA